MVAEFEAFEEIIINRNEVACIIENLSNKVSNCKEIESLKKDRQRVLVSSPAKDPYEDLYQMQKGAMELGKYPFM